MSLFLSFRNSRAGILIREQPLIFEASDTAPVESIDLKVLQRVVAGRDLLFAIHGYNNSESAAICSLARLSRTLKLPDTALFIGILWPGDSFLAFASYPTEKPTARFSGQYLAAFCNRNLSDAASVSFVSHSLGARVALEAIRNLKRETRSACLMAAAIERNCFEKEYAGAFAKTETTYVLASRNDWVLRWAFPFGNIIGHLLDPTSMPLSKALGYAGLERPIGKTRTPWQICDDKDYDHGSYLPSAEQTDNFPPLKPFPPDDDYLKATRYEEAVNFARRAFNQERQIWPPLQC